MKKLLVSYIKEKMQIKNKPAIYLIFGLILLIKLYAQFETKYPIFKHSEIKIYRGNGALLPISVKEKSHLLKIELENHLNQNIYIDLNPDIKWNISIKGERVNYINSQGKIEIPLKSYDWGGVDITIQKKISYKFIIDLIFFTGVIVMLFLQLFNNKFIQYVSVVFTLLYLSIFIYGNWQYLNESINLDELSWRYSQSQYVMGQGSPIIIGDEQVYVLAASQYVKTGDPVSINFEHPPLGKYLYGLGLMLTDKPRLISLAFVITSLILFIWLAKIYLIKEFLIYPEVLLFISNDIFLNLAKTVMLDLPQLIFLILASISYILAVKKNKLIWFLLFAIFTGAMAAVKFYLPAMVFVIATFIDLILNYRKLLKKYLLSLIFIPLVFAVSYWGFFRDKSAIEFAKFQWWLLHWFLGKKDSLGNGGIYLVLILGKIKTWWALEYQKTISFEEWNISWPLSFIAFIFSLWQSFRQKLRPNFVQLWVLGYLFILSLGAIAPNLLVIVLPFIFIESVKFLDNISQVKSKYV